MDAWSWAIVGIVLVICVWQVLWTRRYERNLNRHREKLDETYRRRR